MATSIKQFKKSTKDIKGIVFIYMYIVLIPPALYNYFIILKHSLSLRM